MLVINPNAKRMCAINFHEAHTHAQAHLREKKMQPIFMSRCCLYS